MTDFSKPDLNSTKSNFPGEIRAGLSSCAIMDFTGDTNVPTGTVKFNTAKVAFETWSGSAWVRAFPKAGIIEQTVESTAPSGYLLMNGGTIGDASSGGTLLASANASDLFSAIWNSLSNTEAPVSSGRGASAAADFAAHKTITIPDMRQRFPLGKAASGTGATLGGTGGTIDHLHTGPAHTHPLSANGQALIGYENLAAADWISYKTATAASHIRDERALAGAPNNTSTGSHTGGTALAGSTDSGGTGNTGTANPPFLAVNFIIKI